MQISTLHFLSLLQQQKDFTHASADGLAVPLDRERKRQGGFPAVQKHPGMQHLTLCIQKLMILLSSTSPTPSKSGFFTIILGLRDYTYFFHVSLPSRRNPSPRGLKRWGLPSFGTGTWLKSSFSDSALSIQTSGYTSATVKKEDNLVWKREKHSKILSLHPRNFQDFI